MPIATLLGLLIASVGFIYNTSLNVDTKKILTLLILLLLVAFGTCATSVAFFTFTKKMHFWAFFLRMFALSWFFFILVSIGLILALVYNVDIGQFAIYIVVIFLVVAAGLTYSSTKVRIPRGIRKMKSDRTVSIKEVQINRILMGKEKTINENEIRKKLKEDLAEKSRDDFLTIYIEIEGLLRALLGKGEDSKESAIVMARELKKLRVIDGKTYSALDDIVPLRNAIVHGRRATALSINQGYQLAMLVKNKLQDAEAKRGEIKDL